MSLKKLANYTLKLRDVEADEKTNTVFVLNNTKAERRGQVIFGVPKATGVGLDTVVIPATFIPVELTEQVSKRQLMTSAEFRNAVSRGMLILVKSEWAIAYLESEEAQHEMERLQNQQEFHRTVMTATRTDDIKISNAAELEQMASASTEGTVDANGVINNINPAVIHVVELLKESKDQRGTIASLRAMGELERFDYRYVMENCPNEYQDVINWARKEYNES